MTALAALVLGSALTATAGGIEQPAAEQPAAEQPAADVPSRRERSRRRRAKTANTLAAVGLEFGAGLLYIAAASDSIGRDLSLTSAGCDAPDNPCTKGTPVALLIPFSPPALGGLGAVRVAAAREASLWRSPMFWAGTATQVASLVVWIVSGSQKTRNERLAWDTTFLAGVFAGNVMQVWGAFTAPPREVKPAPRSVSLAPGCGPTTGGVVCGLALAGF